MRTTKQKMVGAVVLFIAEVTAQSVFAYYNPSTGRFLSRDPVGEPGFQLVQGAQLAPQVGPVPVAQQSSRWINRDEENTDLVNEPEQRNLYAFVENAPIIYTDSLGLAKYTCDDVCKLANSLDRIHMGSVGGVVCFKGMKCACAFDGLGRNRGDCPKLDAIIMKHEQKHADKFTCDPQCPNMYRARKPKDEADKEECEHRKESIKDMQAYLTENPRMSAKCRASAEKMKELLEEWVKQNCK